MNIGNPLNFFIACQINLACLKKKYFMLNLVYSTEGRNILPHNRLNFSPSRIPLLNSRACKKV